METIIRLDTREVNRVEDARALIGSLDLLAEIETLLTSGEERTVTVARARLADKAQAVDVAYFPSAGRAGVADGGPAAWTDASSVKDALDLWLADEMVP